MFLLYLIAISAETQRIEPVDLLRDPVAISENLADCEATGEGLAELLETENEGVIVCYLCVEMKGDAA